MRDDARRRILKVHGTLLLILGAANAIISTVGLETGAGPMGFIKAQPFGHVGLVQAYLLMSLIGGILRMGAASPPLRRWNIVGALAHVAVLPAYALHWNAFATYSPTGGQMRAMILVHVVFISLEGYAAVSKVSTVSD